MTDDWIITYEKDGHAGFLACYRIAGGSLHRLTRSDGVPIRFDNHHEAEAAAGREVVRYLNRARVSQQFLMSDRPRPPKETAPQPRPERTVPPGPRRRVIEVDVRRGPSAKRREAEKLFK